VTPEALATTRRALHGVAELLLAGPQHADCQRIQLLPKPGGFGTRFTPDIRVEGTDVVVGERRAAIDGCTIRELGAALGLEPQSLGHVYRDGSGVDVDEVLHVDADAARQVATAYALGDEALRAFAADQTSILWPEHFDLGIVLDEVNYGVSPGDASLPLPYVYAGPWELPPADDFWNQPFGAARDLPATVEDVVAFLEEARARLG